MVPLHLLRDSGEVEKMKPLVFRISRYLPWTLVFALAFNSCAWLGLGGRTAKKKQPSPFGPTGIPPQMRASTTVGGTPVTPGGNVPAKPLNATPESDIIFTDPDSDGALPELATVLSTTKRGPWEESETIARQRSMREGKPLLIWFTDSARSPMCKAVSQELFSTNDFGNWATEKLIRLRVDADVKVNDPDLDLGASEDRRVRIIDYAAELKKRYKVLGFPTLVMLSPNGEVVGKFRGYKRGDATFLWGQIKHGEAVSNESTKGWRASLEKKGYREWEDRKGRKIFARCTDYSKGSFAFIEPDGTRSRTQEDNLSDKDRAWIAEQKKIRNIQ